jgi:hypothetical protein
MSPSQRLRALLLAASALAACARAPAPEVLMPGALNVRIGLIDADALEAAVGSAPRSLPARTEQLVDSLWQAGCLGADVDTPLPVVTQNPDVVCSLHGRSQHRIIVAAHLDGDEAEGEQPRHWTGVALLPFLYRSLAAAPRQHSFVFAAFGKSPPRNARDYLARLGSPHGDAVRAIVDLQDVEPASIWFSSPDLGMRRDLAAASLAVGRPLDTLRSFTPDHGPGPARGGVATLTIAAPPRGRARHRLPSVEAAPQAEPPSLHATARLFAVYLAYADETLRLRAEAAESGAPPHPAAPQQPEPPAPPETTPHTETAPQPEPVAPQPEPR